MSTKVASILAEIGIDSSKFTQGAKGVLGGIGDIIGGFGKMAGAAGILVGAVVEVTKFLKECEQAAVASAQADAKLEAVYKSTAGAADIRLESLKSLAQQISINTGLDDELVTSAEAVLLTFTRIGGDVFPTTMKAAADMSAVLGQDLQGSVVQVGKAMNDFSGYTALKRAGVSFTAEQIKQIENFKATNDLVGYQNLLLKELQTEFGGAANAINEAGDASQNLKVSTENLHEAIGRTWMTDAENINKLLFIMNYNMAESTNKTADFADASENLGYTFIASGIWIKDWQLITAGALQTLIDASNKADIASDRFDLMSGAIQHVGESASLTEEEIKDLNDANKTIISTVERFTDISKLSADEQALATHRVVLSMLEKNLAIDGLDAKETEYLLTKGVEWGVYSSSAVLAMQIAMQEANNLTTAINGIPSAKTINIQTVYSSVGGGSSAVVPVDMARLEREQGRDLNGNGIIGRAQGGPSSGLTWVGEKGPELLDLPGGSYVNNNNASKNMSNTSQTPIYVGITAKEMEQSFNKVMAPIMSNMMSEFAKLT